MSRMSRAFSKHRKDNYSLDIKGVYKTSFVHTPFSKNKDSDSQFFVKLRTQIAHNSSMQSSDKQFNPKQRRRFSLTKAQKNNNSVALDNHLTKQKINTVNNLLNDKKYQECLNLIRQLLLRQQNQYVKNKLYWINANCFKMVGKIKESQHFLTRLVNQEPENYEVLVQRANIRYILGARQLCIRDLRHAIYLNPKKQNAYKQLCKLYNLQGNAKQALAVANLAFQKHVQSIQLNLVIAQIMVDQNYDKGATEKRIQLCKQNINKITSQCLQSGQSDNLYLKAIYFEFKQKIPEACIFYEDCLKFNNSKYAVTHALERLIIIKINQRDYYSAYHTVNRYKILSIDSQLIQPYVLFLQGILLILKKKFQQGIKILDALIQIQEDNQKKQASQKFLISQLKQITQGKLKKQKYSYFSIKIHQKYKKIVYPLLLKFNAYASFKLGNHEASIEYYQNLKHWGMDECSSYNLLLAQGIVAVERRKNFQFGMEKFQQARYVYPCKVQPSIYIAMTVIFRDLCISGITQKQNNYNQSLTSAVVHAIQQLNEAHETICSTSSNLLYHRCILNLYMEQWDSAISDINLCIEKAEQNQPKYFYLRGLCYAVIKDLKKAINQYSISISLDNQFYKSLLQRSKCYFLLGETQSGFSDLKQYMFNNQNDYHVHKWIGDLLYEGRSYHDALKAYSQIDDGLLFQAQVMKCKCLLRVSDLNKVSDCLTKLSKFQQTNNSMIQVDILAVNILRVLTRSHQSKQIISKIKKLNSMLQQNQTGYIFNLIDCMNLLGIATFDIGRYQQAYQSFLLVLQLFTSLIQKNKSQLKSDCAEQGLSLSLQDVYINIVYSLIGMKDFQSALKIAQGQLLSCSNSQKSCKKIQNILKKYQSEQANFEYLNIQPDLSKNQRIKFKEIALKLQHIKIKCSPIFGLFHACIQDLYSKAVTKKMIKSLKPSFIDNMPEGPWIKRNQHGVVFTDHMIQDSGSDFLSSMRVKQSEEPSQQLSNSIEHQEEEFEKKHRDQFKRKMKLDDKLQQKLNQIIKNSI